METGPDNKVPTELGFARRGDYLVWDKCFQMKNFGFPQKRKFQSMYYVRPDMLICIDDLSALKNDGATDFENIFATLVFKPRLEDLLEEMQPFFHEIVKMSDDTYFAYSTVEEDPAYIAETGRTDKYIRSRGETPWDALVSLYIDVQKAIRKQDGAPRTLPQEVLEDSENQHEALIDPNLP